MGAALAAWVMCWTSRRSVDSHPSMVHPWSRLRMVRLSLGGAVSADCLFLCPDLFDEFVVPGAGELALHDVEHTFDKIGEVRDTNLSEPSELPLSSCWWELAYGQWGHARIGGER